MRISQLVLLGLLVYGCSESYEKSNETRRDQSDATLRQGLDSATSAVLDGGQQLDSASRLAADTGVNSNSDLGIDANVMPRPDASIDARHPPTLDASMDALHPAVPDASMDAGRPQPNRDAEVDAEPEINAGSGEAALSGCFGLNPMWRTCDPYCESIGERCVTAGCNGVTLEIWQGFCAPNQPPNGLSAQACSQVIPTVGGRTHIRCCCEPL